MDNKKYDLSKMNEEILHVLRSSGQEESFSAALLDELSSYGTIVNYPSNSVILKTGEINDSIYFLISGSLNVFFENEAIATMEKKGSLLGEMSIISNNPCSADVITQTETCLLKISTKKLKNEASDFDHLLRKIICVALSEKLEATNLKAKNFELLNRTLTNEVEKRTLDLKSQNAELILSYKKLENMHMENMLILNKLTAIDEDLVQSSLQLLDASDIENKRETLKSNLKLIQKYLSPIRLLKNEQDYLEGQKVLVVESNIKQRNMIKIALGGTGVKVDLAKSSDEAMEALRTSSYSILFLSANMLEVADFVKTKQIKVKIVLLTEEESKDYINKIKKYDFLSNIIATKQDDRAFNIKSICTTVSKMTSSDIFGLEKYLNWGVEVRELEISDSAERQGLIDKVTDYLSELGLRNSIKTRCQSVLEELLMNAIYDAPVDKNGTPLHNHKSRRERITLEQNQRGKLRYATDGLYLAVSVEDPFGVFKKETIFKYLEENYNELQDVTEQLVGKGGAGKGLFIVTENSDLVIYNIAPQTKTEVVVLFDLDPLKEKKTTSLHYFEL